MFLHDFRRGGYKDCFRPRWVLKAAMPGHPKKNPQWRKDRLPQGSWPGGRGRLCEYCTFVIICIKFKYQNMYTIKISPDCKFKNSTKAE
jgi:hypothetical protein